MWFGKCLGKQELHIKIGRDMWWFLNDFGIGKPSSFSSRNSVEHRPIVKNLGRFLLSTCDNRHRKILVLGGNSNIYLPRNLRFSRARWGGLKMYRLTPEATGCFSMLHAATHFTLHMEGPWGSHRLELQRWFLPLIPPPKKRYPRIWGVLKTMHCY